MAKITDYASIAEEKRASSTRNEQLAQLASTLKRLRKEKHLSLEGLSERSGVSRSMISKIERAEAMPSTSVLSRLAEALESSFSQLLVEEQQQDIVVLPQRIQPVLRDQDSGYTRRCISPILPGRGIDWVLNVLPVGSTTGEFSGHRVGVAEYLYVLSGTLEANVGNETHRLEAGDAIYFQATKPHEFRNLGKDECQYFLVIDSTPFRR